MADQHTLNQIREIFQDDTEDCRGAIIDWIGENRDRVDLWDAQVIMGLPITFVNGLIEAGVLYNNGQARGFFGQRQGGKGGRSYLLHCRKKSELPLRSVRMGDRYWYTVPDLEAYKANHVMQAYVPRKAQVAAESI